jgi:hypothetical protein
MFNNLETPAADVAKYDDNNIIFDDDNRSKYSCSYNNESSPLNSSDEMVRVCVCYYTCYTLSQIIFTARTKLYRYANGEFHQRGVGDIQIIECTTTGRMRVVMRRDIVHTLCANFNLDYGMWVVVFGMFGVYCFRYEIETYARDEQDLLMRARLYIGDNGVYMFLVIISIYLLLRNNLLLLDIYLLLRNTGCVCILLQNGLCVIFVWFLHFVYRCK